MGFFFFPTNDIRVMVQKDFFLVCFVVVA